MKRSAVIAVAMLLGACASKGPGESEDQGWFKGENLIIPDQQLYSDWVPYKGEEPGHTSMMWQHPKYGFQNSLIVDIWHRKHVNLQEYRQKADSSGKKSCLSFDSKTTAVESSYDSLMWSTHCKLPSNKEARMINYVIQGRDSYYHIMKIFKGVEVSEAEIESWRDAISKAYVCDTRREERKCPEGYERLGGM